MPRLTFHTDPDVNKQLPDSLRVCDLRYVTKFLGGRVYLVNEVIDLFIAQFPEEQKQMNEAVKQEDYASIQQLAHSMNSSIALISIPMVKVNLQELEGLGRAALDMKRIIKLNLELNFLGEKMMTEIVEERIIINKKN